jgi:hypothetical protein
MTPKIIKDFASFFPGVFLVLGFFCAKVATRLEPAVQPPEQDLVAQWADEIIGNIPKDRFYYEPDQGTKPVVARKPKLDDQGVPILSRVSVPPGRGRPVLVGEELKEITIPRLSKSPFDTTHSVTHTRPGMVFHLDDREVRPNEDKEYDPNRDLIVLHYYPNIEFIPTGVFERRHLIEYRTKVDPITFSVIGTLVGTIIGVICMLYENTRPRQTIPRAAGNSAPS